MSMLHSPTPEAIRHSLAHLLAAAVLEKYPSAELAIGPAIEHGFYYDIRFPEPISESNLPAFEARMRELIEQKLPFTGKTITAREAHTLFDKSPFKRELIDELEKNGEPITVYHTGNIFADLCRGGHVENTGEIDPDSFALTSIAGAYWRGNEKNAMLTRIYGLAFATRAELDAHKKMLEEAEKRDHRKLGRELDLFVFSELVGAGLPLWTPKGTVMRNILDSLVWKMRKERGYEQVDIPHITKKELYETSGHWEKFSDELFRVSTREGRLYAMKPMNCPHHTQIYNRKLWSYRELPQRYASTTKVYRDEQSGELSGLSRVLAITQDDAHVFCRTNQVKEEIFKIWDIVHAFYGLFGFDLSVRLSLHDPSHPEKYLGTPEIWTRAEQELRDLVRERGVSATEAPGEAALYGPKIDFMGRDAIGRPHQVATIQLDLNLPERFDLVCINERGERERIVMIHAAIMGSIERFLSVLIEHYAGAFPAWLAPVQVAVLPIADTERDYALRVHAELIRSGIRAELYDMNETLGKKIRLAKTQKIPYYLVLGKEEVTAKKVMVESRDDGKLGLMDIDQFVHSLPTP